MSHYPSRCSAGAYLFFASCYHSLASAISKKCWAATTGPKSEVDLFGHEVESGDNLGFNSDEGSFVTFIKEECGKHETTPATAHMSDALH
ncbi:hypothetical protein CLAFUW4_01845 [Fulvia fulva]|uniref:Uncharacterized protein n=1 Tax=Passalora fulva TaxID=5499 RepID=A0A9Q8P3C9_PASFU|nr:uncharacterized protein CLAFUR5_01840 [Fulvia fulva]KAK4634578.1 hypothetical protein CLAFUR4_01840 [Fulvia fulva]KAK4638044.1 hypothetical protein CLAFUR0_01842 [Fulvia fulva]UJO11895.1 hypothetical protein CLAFUR5_01840 [Fulvia fulva]WPV09891.1 hypothetical protein CLAFUW4_01845 [Fulvia fulva]WPV25279.1 hypothetical protein CLAFUW7_01844 [Fulvia fulva]